MRYKILIFMLMVLIIFNTSCSNIGKSYISPPEEKYKLLTIRYLDFHPYSSIYIKKEDYKDNKLYLLNNSKLSLSNIHINNSKFIADAEYLNVSGTISLGPASHDFEALNLGMKPYKKLGPDGMVYRIHFQYLYFEQVDINKSIPDWNYAKITFGRIIGFMPYDAEPYMEYIKNNKYCENASDCWRTCGYGCVNIHWLALGPADMDCIEIYNCTCINNICVRI